jgi:hypothetical protein
MIEKRTEGMIHNTLESGGSITQAKGNYHEFIVTLMSSKYSLGNVLCVGVTSHTPRIYFS